MKHFMFSAFAALCFTLLLGSCSHDSSTSVTPVNQKIVGTVVDDITGLPIPNVIITYDNGSGQITTGNDGVFLLETLNDLLKITAEKEGYEKIEINITITPDKPTTITIRLRRHSDNDFDKFLLAYYPLDGNGNDASSFAWHGTTSNTATVADRLGREGRALAFNSAIPSFVDIPYSVRFNPEEFTYSFWMKPESNPGVEYTAGAPVGYIDIISRWEHWGDYYSNYLFGLDHNGLVKSIVLNNDGGTHNYSYIQTDGREFTTEWTHVAFTYSQNTMKIYINGQLKKSQYCIRPQDSYYYGIRIGARISIERQYSAYNGLLDEVRFYGKALDDAQIASVYNMQ